MLQMFTVIWGWVKTLVPLVNIKIAGKWMVIPLKMVLIGIDPYPFQLQMEKNMGKKHGKID